MDFSFLLTEKAFRDSDATLEHCFYILNFYILAFLIFISWLK